MNCVKRKKINTSERKRILNIYYSQYEARVCIYAHVHVCVPTRMHAPNCSIMFHLSDRHTHLTTRSRKYCLHQHHITLNLVLQYFLIFKKRFTGFYVANRTHCLD